MGTLQNIENGFLGFKLGILSLDLGILDQSCRELSNAERLLKRSQCSPSLINKLLSDQLDQNQY